MYNVYIYHKVHILQIISAIKGRVVTKLTVLGLTFANGNLPCVLCIPHCHGAKCYCMVYKTYLTDTRADEAMIRIVATRNVNVLYDHSP